MNIKKWYSQLSLMEKFSYSWVLLLLLGIATLGVIFPVFGIVLLIILGSLFTIFTLAIVANNLGML